MGLRALAPLLSAAQAGYLEVHSVPGPDVTGPASKVRRGRFLGRRRLEEPEPALDEHQRDHDERPEREQQPEKGYA